MKRGSRCAALLLFAALAWAVPAFSEEEGPPGEQLSVTARLDEIRAEVSAEEQALDQLTQRGADLKREKQGLDRTVAKLAAERTAIQKELAELELKRRELNEQSATAAKELDQLRRVAGARVRASYAGLITGSDSPLLRVVSSRGTTLPLSSRITYLRAIDENDRRLFEQLHAGISEYRRLEGQIAEAQSAKELARRALTEKESALRAKSTEMQKVASALAQQQRELENHLIKLRAQQLRLESVIVSITSGELLEQRSAELDSERADEGQTGLTADSTGTGLPKVKKGAFATIVAEGKQVERFGVRKKSGSVSKGYSYSGPAESAVAAAYGGQVLFVGNMPLYGSVVIIDHGARYYTLYAGDLEVTVGKGDQVQRGSQLAKVTRDGGQVLFELRHEGKAVDPSGYMQ